MILKELLTEARRSDLPYTEKKVKGLVDKVVVELSGNDSGVMTKMLTRYKRLDQTAKLAKEKRDELNEKIKVEAEDLFDAEDNILTRVVETIQCTMTLSKAIKAAEKDPKKIVDYEKILKALSEQLPELEEKIKELTKVYTTIEDATDSPTALRVKIKEGLGDKIKSLWSKFVKSLSSWTKSFDKKQGKIKADMTKLGLKV